MASRFSVEAIFRAYDRITAPVTAMQNRVGKFARALNSSFQTVNRSINSVAKSIYGAGKTALKYATVAAGTLSLGLLGVVREFSKIENARAAFTPLLGSVDKAKTLVAELNTLMVDTPFEFEALTDTASQLLPVMNQDINKTIETIKLLGDTAGGNAQKLESITRGYTKAMLKGKVDLESLNMIGEAGVPIFTELAKSMGRDVNAAFFKMISAGKVSTQQLTEAFRRMTSEGGIFFNGMKIASVTTSALWSGFMDNVKSTAAVIGEELDPYVKELIGYMTEVTQKLRTWVTLNREFLQQKLAQYVDLIKRRFAQLVDSFSDMGRTEGMLTTVIELIFSIGRGIKWLVDNADGIAKFVKWVLILGVALKALAVVIGIVNIAMMANPLGLIVIAIGLVIAAIASAIIWFDELKAWFNGAPTWVQTAVSLILGPLGALVSAANTLWGVWEVFGEDFKDMWAGILDTITAVVKKLPLLQPTLSALKWAGLVDETAGGDDAATSTTDRPMPQMVSPQERVSRSITENSAFSFAELLIKDQTGKAEMTQKGNAPGIKFSVVPTGAF